MKHGFGVDIGGSGIKGAVVDLDTPSLVGDRLKVLTSGNPSTGRPAFGLMAAPERWPATTRLQPWTG